MLLEVMNARESNGGIGVDDRLAFRGAGGVLHDYGEAGELTKEARLRTLIGSEVPNAEISPVSRGAIKKRDSHTPIYSNWGFRTMAAAVREPSPWYKSKSSMYSTVTVL
jgi:hypothetical protein